MMVPGTRRAGCFDLAPNPWGFIFAVQKRIFYAYLSVNAVSPKNPKRRILAALWWSGVLQILRTENLKRKIPYYTSIFRGLCFIFAKKQMFHSGMKWSCFSRLRPMDYAMPSLKRRFMKRTCGAWSTAAPYEAVLSNHEAKPFQASCFFARIWAKKMVAGPRIELGTRGFSVPCSTDWANLPLLLRNLERVTGVEPATITLATWCSTNWATLAHFLQHFLIYYLRNPLSSCFWKIFKLFRSNHPMKGINNAPSTPDNNITHIVCHLNFFNNTNAVIIIRSPPKDILPDFQLPFKTESSIKISTA